MPRRYIVVSPVRNEAEFLPLTLCSLAQQTTLPALWVIVNDGSSDATGKIADEAATQHPWIRVLHRKDRGFRQAGGGVVESFYDGLGVVGDQDWDYLVKLDGDLSFDADYFGQCLGRFEANAQLGIAGGTVSCYRNGVLESESKVDPPFHVRGATKIYRRDCWRAIGGLIRAPGWDTMDEVKANMLGWTTCTLPNIRVIHHRPAGGAYGSWNNWVKNGHANYVAGYHPVFMLIKCLRRMIEPPYLLGGCGLLWGFFGGYARRAPQIDDRELIRYFRRQQINRLLGRRSLWDLQACTAGECHSR